MIPQGQLSHDERDYLRKTVIGLSPEIILESGTWYGGGSTYSLASALRSIYKGFLYTWEENFNFYNVANNFYSNDGWEQYVKCINGDFISGVADFESDLMKNVSMVFLDGGDENERGTLKLPENMYPEYSENLASFKILEKRLSINSHVLLHDWEVKGGRGTFVKWYLDNKNWYGWELINIKKGSTGLAHLIKNK